MIPNRVKTFACATAVSVTSCGGAANTVPHASGAVEPQPALASSGGGLGLRGDGVGDANDPSKVRGRLPPEVIQNIVRANFGVMRKCYEEGLGRDPTLKGKIATKFVIALDGTVSTAAEVHDSPPGAVAPNRLAESVKEELDDPRFPDPTVTECVVSIFKELRFPRPQGGILTVVYPIIFKPEE